MLDQFLPNEPLSVALGIGREESTEYYRKFVREALQHPVNYALRCVDDGRIIALRLTSILRRPPAGSIVETPHCDDPSPKVRELQRVDNELESRIWQVVPSDVNCLLYWVVLSVHSSYARRGIAYRFIHYRLEEARALGCQGAIAEGFAYKSQRLFEKAGYKTVYEVRHEDWKDANGNRIFHCKDKTDRITLAFRRL
ncbi:acetyltransferase [Aphelenchoides avenae]|nr:acetyltransferase [Aphelenchus avenae]